ncbi:Nucleolar protein 56 [Saitoella coloradoensis]
MPVPTYLLSELASGYALYEVKEAEEVGSQLKEVKEALQDLARFGKMVNLVSFAPFKTAAHALENANDISEGIVNDHLKAFLETNLPKPGKKNKVIIGVTDKNLAGGLKEAIPGLECDNSEVSLDLLRGIRFHGEKLLRQLQAGDIGRAQLGLGHSYSRCKVKFNVNRSDNMIIQAIALLDQLDKDINTFSMRVREWYSWHFPELVRIVNDNHQFAKLARFIEDKNRLTDDMLHDIAALVEDDEAIAKAIIDASKVSMGQDLSEVDMENVVAFADRVVNLAEYRKRLYTYLQDKMSVVAPNLSELIGEVVGARLISHAGSLTNLSKYPASTVQILGAEKALFRALKTKGNTPKYGLIYHSSFIGRAGQKNKGRISRFLANKCSIASRIDNFSDAPTTKFGEVLRQQVEERLNFYEKGEPVTKNADAMRQAMDAVLAGVKVEVSGVAGDAREDIEMDDVEEKKSKKDKKRKAESSEESGEKKSKKDKKEKKEKKDKKEKKSKE